MHVNGHTIKDRRRALGISQTDLAQGICTQATISLVENKNRIPKVATLKQIAGRLDLEMNELVAEYHPEQDQLLGQIFEHVLNQRWRKAEVLLEQIKFSSLKTRAARIRYHTLQAVMCNIRKHSAQAIGNALEALTLIGQAKKSPYRMLVRVQLALAYLHQQKGELMQESLSEAIRLARSWVVKTPRDAQLIEMVVYRAAEIYMKQAKYARVITVLNFGIKQVEQQGVTWHLDKLYSLRGQAQYILRRFKLAYHDYHMAYAAATFNRDKGVRVMSARYLRELAPYCATVVGE
ncbi:XRE family transcriptional regulator [Periweissella cryptocerci]|uniref:XRE family transcriptional regulator n=1 Tax=Periweissella cryptocerci TaxID=2506420 RepID=A0A4P6YSM5_9LACO|nr:helix-turn-helix transcriptional regulator [Periweissella cryptocerci]QBO35642.1 XRE family transcriptional regulator [Periweissella cryptocerci]